MEYIKYLEYIKHLVIQYQAYEQESPCNQGLFLIEQKCGKLFSILVSNFIKADFRIMVHQFFNP